MQDLLTIEELSTEYGLSKSYIYQRTSAKEIPFYRIGRRVEIRRADFEKYLQKNCYVAAI